jgi:PadR family transcriptional regulator, regulatory protein AphA
MALADEAPEPSLAGSQEPAERNAPLTPTGRVILGMIATGRRTGYEMKQLVDKATRHFWAASYGQIYPELRRLEQQGLIEGRSEPSGGRARTVYELTTKGHEALGSWLGSESELVWELRDEGMLKLFFSDVRPGAAIETVRAMRTQYERKHAALRTIETHAAQMPRGPGLTLAAGLALTRCQIEWCTETERRLLSEEI